MNTTAKTYRSTKDIAASVRASLKAQLPGWKFSVKMKSYSGGSSITLSLMQGPEQVIEAVREYLPQGGMPVTSPCGAEYGNPSPGYAQLNHYQLLSAEEREQERRLTNGYYLTPKGWQVMRKATLILSEEHWDKSEIQVDYFSTNFYRHVNIGRWDKDYEVK